MDEERRKFIEENMCEIIDEIVEILKDFDERIRFLAKGSMGMLQKMKETAEILDGIGAQVEIIKGILEISQTEE